MKYLTLDTLVSHPKNVRAKTEYGEDSITALAASIKALGLLQSLVVQQLDDGTYGVLAGRRRMMALQQLAAANDLDDGFKAPCKVIAKDTDHVTALSLAENTMQEPMAPLDEYEAFAAMIEEGETVETIAITFGTNIRTVKERLRYGLVHPDIRAALRAGAISLDLMKTYASHPCQETQKRVFDGFMSDPSQHQTWRVRETLKEQDIRADDPLAIIVMDRYRERGGEMVVGLFEEDTVLKDRALAEAIRDEMLMEAAEEIRLAKGFKWAETRDRIDYSELSGYGRIYTHALELDEAGNTRLGEIAERLDEIAGLLDEGDHADIDHEALSEEYDTLEEEADTLQNGYVPEQAAHAGIVVALASDGSVRSEMGLVRPEDYAALNAQAEEEDAAYTPSNDDGEDDIDTAPPMRTHRAVAPPSTGATIVGLGGKANDKPVDPLGRDALSAALRDDLGVERAHILHAELSDNPDLANDLLIFTLAADVLRVAPCYEMNNIRGASGSRTHSRPEAVDAGILTDLDNTRGALDLSFCDSSMSAGERFRAFRAMDADAKAAIMAYCVGAAVDPGLPNNNPDKESMMEAVASEAIEDIRTFWKPTAANYWGRTTRDHMLALLKVFGLDAEAEEQRNVKKATLAAYMESLFAQPFATLTDEQRIAVETWTPPGMGTQGDVVFDIEGDDDGVCEDTNAEGEAGGQEGDTACSNLKPGEKAIGQNIHGETLIEDANGVRSVETGGVLVTEPVPVIPGAGIVAPNHSDRKVRFLTVAEADERKDAA